MIRADSEFHKISAALAKMTENYKVCKQILLETLHVKLGYEKIIKQALKVKGELG